MSMKFFLGAVDWFFSMAVFVCMVNMCAYLDFYPKSMAVVLVGGLLINIFSSIATSARATWKWVYQPRCVCDKKEMEG